MTNIELLDRIVPISDFNRGKASSAFNRVCDGQPIVVIKRNVPSFVILTTNDYRRAAEAEEDLHLLQLASQRAKDANPTNTIGRDELLSKFGILEAELAETAEVDFE